MKTRYEGPWPVVTVKAPNSIAAQIRVMHACDKGLVPPYYEMRVTEIAPANAAGNATFECRLLIGRD